MRKVSLFIEELEGRIAPMCILPEHGNRPCNDTNVYPWHSPNEAAFENANGNAAFNPQITTLAIGEEAGGW